MPIPPFILELRKKVGHDLLLLPGLVAVVFDKEGRVLLHQRSDTAEWSLISGMLEPDEQPIPAIEREVLEETNVRARVSRMVHTWTSPRITYANGDCAQYLTVAFRCEYVSGEPRVNDDESLAVRFFSPTELPPLREDLERCIALARML